MTHALDPQEPDTLAPMDDLAVGLAKAQRTPWLTRSTGVMLGLVLLCGGFITGIKVQQGYGTSGSTGTPGSGQQRGGFGQFGGGQLPGGQRGGTQGGGTQGGTASGTAGAVTTGTIKLVDGGTIYLETADGNVITVKTDTATTVQSASKLQLKDLKAGTSVTVQGTTTADSTVTATSVTATK